jgi:hypothetical protein
MHAKSSFVEHSVSYGKEFIYGLSFGVAWVDNDITLTCIDVNHEREITLLKQFVFFKEFI